VGLEWRRMTRRTTQVTNDNKIAANAEKPDLSSDPFLSVKNSLFLKIKTTK
jgi:hypothetical protein